MQALRFDLDEHDDIGFVQQVRPTSDDNARRLISRLFPRAAVFWWSGGSRTNQRGSLMAYLPASASHDLSAPTGAHSGWYVDFKKVREWTVGKTLRTTPRELSTYSAAAPAG